MDWFTGSATLLMVVAMIIIAIFQIRPLKNQIKTTIERSRASMLPQIYERFTTDENLIGAGKVVDVITANVGLAVCDIDPEAPVLAEYKEIVNTIDVDASQVKKAYDKCLEVSGEAERRNLLQLGDYYEIIGYLCKKAYLSFDDIIELKGKDIVHAYYPIKALFQSILLLDVETQLKNFDNLFKKANIKYPHFLLGKQVVRPSE